VLLKKAKYHFILTTVILLSCTVHAQDEETDQPVVDTAAVIVEELVEEPSYTDTYQSETRTDYFLPKYLPEASMDSLMMRELSDSAVAALKKDDDFWYANHVFTKEQPDSKKGSGRSGGIGSFYNGLLWFLIIGGFITFLVIYLINSNVKVLRGSRSIHGREDQEAVEMDNIFAINYQKEIDKAIRAGNNRLAVRLMFLRLLKLLSDRNVIQYKQDRTNFDYLMQMHNTVWYKPFFRLARNYEYVWYGKFDIDNNQFDNIRSEFTNLERQL
jgi:hypothetical protein